MTKTVVTKNDILERYSPIQDLGTLFKTLEAEFLQKGEVICQFRLNGMTLSETDESRLAEIHIHEVEKIEIDSENPTTLLFGLLDNWIKELPELIKNTDELSKTIRFNGIEGHLKSLVDLIDSCQFLMDSLVGLQSIIKSDLIDKNEWKKAEEMTVRAIGESIRAFEIKDFVLLAEILEYDLAHSLQIWTEQLVRVEEGLKEENARDGQEFSDRVFNKKG
jgi:hypothetical protein